MKHTSMISLPDHSLADPHLLRGKARVEELGRLLGLGVRRLLARQEAEKRQLEQRRLASLVADKSSSARKLATASGRKSGF
jgi:hypothetical protein